MQSVTIELPAGTFEIEYGAALEEQVRNRYNMPPDALLDVALIKLFIEQELRSALSKDLSDV